MMFMLNRLKQSRWFLYGLLLFLGCLYWCLDSSWSYMSYERNLNALIYMVPSSFVDTFLLQVPPYQTVSRLSVLALLFISGILLIEFSNRKEKIATALIESEERYQYLIEHANVGTCIIQDQRVKIPNLKFLEITGYSSDELTALTFPDIVHSDDLNMTMRWYTKAINGVPLATDTPFQIVTKEKDVRWLQLSTTPIVWQGKTAHFNIIHDVTDSRNREKKDQQAKKMEAIGLLAGGVAHDLNNIFSGIVSYPEMIMNQLSEDNPMYSQLEIIQDSGLRAAAIVADLLTVARGAAISRSIIDLNKIVTDFLNTPECKILEERYPEVELVSSGLCQNKVYLSCSDIHIQKSIMNLMFNAFEALEKNSGKITISTNCRDISDKEAHYLNIQTGRYAVLSIADTGPGISKDQKEQIFEPFYTKKKMGRSGTGLGLTVVWNTVVDHNGSIDVETSELGTTFSLYLPTVPAPVISSASVKKCDSEVCKGSGERVLIIDDDSQQRKIGQQFLAFLNYTPLSVSSGEEAIEFLRNEKVDLLILDMIMDPGINGRETYEQILAIRPEQKALIVSGYSEHNEITKTIELGAGELLKKPYTMQSLATALYTELNRL